MNDAKVSFTEAARFWAKLGFISFGGPAGQIAIMQHECVDRRRWINQGVFLRGLNYCMLLPGPEAQQLATYIGWRLHGVWGGIIAGGMFVIPGTVLMLFLAWIAAAHGDTSLIAAVFDGIKPVVVAVVLHALWRIGRRTLHGPAAFGLAAAAFVGLYFLKVSFPLIVLAAGVIGVALANVPAARLGEVGHGPSSADAPADDQADESPPANDVRRILVVAATTVALWAAPVAAAIVFLGSTPFADVARLFTTAAFVTFGGAYAVLPYIAQAGVETYRWLTPADMINGLALAETTPGPLILVNTYVGFFAGWNAGVAIGGVAAPGWAGMVGGLLATWVTFLPSFLFILAGAPYIEPLQTNRWARSALAAITAAVVGVILNLAVYLAKAVFFPIPPGPEATPILDVNWTAVGVAVAALGLAFSGRISVPWLVAGGAAFGLVAKATA